MIKTEINQAIDSQVGPAVGQAMMRDAKFFSGYSRWSEEHQRYETWKEAVQRVVDMHLVKYASKLSPEVSNFLAEAQVAYEEQLVLGAQRALQFGGSQLLRHQAKMYNCASSYANRPNFFQGAMYLLLCGCGVGFSVQRRHVSQLPKIAARSKTEAMVYEVPDSIEGWANSFGVLLSSYFVERQTFPQYAGKQVVFDFSKVRPRGSLISGGFKAPGPDGLRNALIKCQELLERTLSEGRDEMRSIVVYDFVMHMADAVISGGVRRSATICLFDKDDEEMLKAKTGNWFKANPQRGRSNNSAMIHRDSLTREEWAKIFKNVRDFGEPGFLFVEDLDITVNPCVEIGKYPQIEENGVIEYGFQFCNLVEINGGACTNPEIFYRACRAAAILATFQAGYTDFSYLEDATRKITEREALIGVSITGWMNNPDVLFDEEVLRKGAEIVKAVNKEVAKLLGINPAARATCVKPSGNASVLLGTASGIHGEHAPRYLRNVQMSDTDEVAQLIMKTNPKMVEKSVWSANGTDVMVSFPIESRPGSVFKDQLLGVKQLELVKKAQQTWIEFGTTEELCTRPYLRHNVSNTITVDNWDEVEQYLFDNRHWFAGVSLLPMTGEKVYAQAPFTTVYTAEELVKMYGNAAMFASGLIVDGLAAFNDDLWAACAESVKHGVRLAPGLTMAASSDKKFSASLIDVVEDPLQRDWVRRLHKFANNFFGGNLVKTEHCLKDVHNLHKWTNIINSMKAIDFTEELTARTYVSADTLASQACAGGVCELSFN